MESTPEGTFYTPNKWIGLIVTTLVIGRLAGRMVTLYESGSEATPGAGLQRSPLTIGIFFLMATYYVAYYAGVLQKARA
jgi:hypothetical protein